MVLRRSAWMLVQRHQMLGVCPLLRLHVLPCSPARECGSKEARRPMTRALLLSSLSCAP